MKQLEDFEDELRRQQIKVIIKMILQVKISLTTTGVFLSFIKTIALFFAVFLVCDLSVTVEAKSLTGTRTYKNATLLSRTMRYLTIGNQGITGEISNGPYGKMSYFDSLISLEHEEF